MTDFAAVFMLLQRGSWRGGGKRRFAKVERGRLMWVSFSSTVSVPQHSGA